MSWLIGKDSDAGRDWGQEEKGTTEDEMSGWHHQLDGREFEWTLGDGDGQGGLACCDSWGCKELDTTEQLKWTELNWNNQRLSSEVPKYFVHCLYLFLLLCMSFPQFFSSQTLCLKITQTSIHSPSLLQSLCLWQDWLAAHQMYILLFHMNRILTLLGVPRCSSKKCIFPNLLFSSEWACDLTLTNGISWSLLKGVP